MEFKSGGNLVEIDLQREGSTFVYDELILHANEELWLEVNGKKHKATVTKIADVWWVHVLGHTLQYEVIEPGAAGLDDDKGLTAPMPGKILEVHVKVGQSVSAGDTLVIMEAMKMEHKITAGSDGVIESIFFNPGDQVEQGTELLSLLEVQ